jgi:hypothetical protein
VVHGGKTDATHPDIQFKQKYHPMESFDSKGGHITFRRQQGSPARKLMLVLLAEQHRQVQKRNVECDYSTMQGRIIAF